MRLRIMSDLHLEFAPIDLEPAGEDLAIFAGDVHVGTRGVEWLRTYAHRYKVPTVYVAGNHEYYGGSIVGVDHALSQATKRDPYLRFLQGTAAKIGDVIVVAATLWTDYGSDADAMAVGRAVMNDYHVVADFTPEASVDLHRRHLAAIDGFLRAPQRRPVVVVTHHAPSLRSIHERYRGEIINAAFASDLEQLIERTRPALWVHGHVHDSFDYVVGQTRVVCNPRGYAPHDVNPSFDPNLVVEI